jgi:hypothetical protein
MEGAGRVHARRVFCPSIDLPLSGEGGGRHAGGRGGEEGYGRGTRMGNGREGGGIAVKPLAVCKATRRRGGTVRRPAQPARHAVDVRVDDEPRACIGK